MLGVTMHAQNNVSLAVYQDLGMAVKSDDYGNNAFTSDITIKLKMNGFFQPNNEIFIGYMYMAPIVEIADLAGGNYVRYGAEIGYTFTELYISNIRTEITPLVNYGFLNRTYNDNKTFSVKAWEFGLQYGIPLSPYIKLLALGTITQANDLQVLWGSDAKKWRKNFSIGIEISFTKSQL